MTFSYTFVQTVVGGRLRIIEVASVEDTVGYPCSKDAVAECSDCGIHVSGAHATSVSSAIKIFELLKACCEGKGENDYVFTRENGKQVRDFVSRGRTPRQQRACPACWFTTSGALVPETCDAAALIVT